MRQLDPYIGSLPLASVRRGTLCPFIEARRRQGRKAKTINLALGVVRHVLNLAASEWLDERNLNWLATPPKIKLLHVGRITTHYAAAGLASLLQASKRVCEGAVRKMPALVVLKRQVPAEQLASA